MGNRHFRSTSAPAGPFKATTASSRPQSNWNPPHRKPAGASFATHTLIGAIAVLLALFFQVFAPHFPHTILRLFTKDQHWHVSAPEITLRNPLFLHEPQICPKPEQIVEFSGTFNTHPKRSMALAEQAKRVAAEFDFSDDGVNKAVKEFIREMGMRLRIPQWAIETLTARRRGPATGGYRAEPDPHLRHCCAQWH